MKTAKEICVERKAKVATDHVKYMEQIAEQMLKYVLQISDSKKKAYKDLLDVLDGVLSNNGCNDYLVENTPEMYEAIEAANAANYRLTVEEWKKHEDYYAPSVSKDKCKIFKQDFTVLAMIRKDLGL